MENSPKFDDFVFFWRSIFLLLSCPLLLRAAFRSVARIPRRRSNFFAVVRSAALMVIVRV